VPGAGTDVAVQGAERIVKISYEAARIIPSAVDPPARGAGLGLRVKMERPTGRTILTRPPGLLGLPASMAGGIISANPSHPLGASHRGSPHHHPGAGAPPPEVPPVMAGL